MRLILCLTINNDELFCNAFPFKNSYDFISGYTILRRGAYSTGNLSSFIYLFYLFKCIFYSLQYKIPDLIKNILFIIRIVF